MDTSLEQLQVEEANPLPASTPIQDFYAGAKVFITGATGFLGKALAEKLLRSCHQVDTIYYLVRVKRGVAVSDRHEKLLSSSVFDRIKQEQPDLLKKLTPISGDVSAPELGLSPQDRLLLENNVNVVFHSAATVKFDEPIDVAFNMNAGATIKMLELARRMKNLKAYVHVSTAFSNPEKTEIKEEVYPSPVTIEELLEVCKIADEKEKEAKVKKMLGGHPNTYTFTKAMAESIVNDHAKDLPVAIVRPSIVTGAVSEPMPGWIDNFTSVSGIMIEVGRGSLKSIFCEKKCISDLIPVDIVVNTLIAAAWKTFSQRQAEKAVVYNCTSGTLNPVLWNDFKDLTVKHSIEYPSKYVTFYPNCTLRTNFLLQWFATFAYQILPALLFDTYYYLSGKRVFMYSLIKKFIHACVMGRFFATNEWDFHCDNIVALQKDVLCDFDDAKNFRFDVRDVEWDSYIRDYVIGLRTFVLRDSLISLPAARQKLNRIYWITTVLSYSLLAVVCSAGCYVLASYF